MDMVRTTATVVVAAAAALLGWAVVRVADVSLTVDQGGSVSHVGAVAVVLSTLVVGVAAAASQAVMTRWRGGLRWWLVLAAGVLVLSLLSPFEAATTTSATLALMALHVLVGVVLIGWLRVRPGDR